MHRSLRDNGLFRSSSNYRVDNEGFDSKKPRLLFLPSSLSSLFFRADGAASPFRVPSSDGLEARWRKEKKKERKRKKDEMKRRRRRRGENEERGGSERGSLGRNRHERKAREEFWLRKPRRQMRTSERGYAVEGTARRQLLFSSCSF